MADDRCEEPVQTESGLVSGLNNTENDTCSWLGVPYAAPPVDDLRWKSPQPAPEWPGVREANKFGDRCMQGGLMELLNNDKISGVSEDCLYLNVWRPKKEGKLPVMIWIHGGAYYGGSGDSPMYWGDRLAEAGDLVVVTINYRLSVFGFFAHPDLRKEDPNDATGGQGSLDQVAAINWVHQNIENFGGDPENVTIFGESAGGWSVCTMLATPLNKGKFSRAIIESGGCEISQSLEKGYDQSRGIAELLGCSPDDLQCLRAVPAEKLIKKGVGSMIKRIVFMPHHDGYLLTDTPLAMIRAGNYNKVPLMAGSNRHEADALTMFEPKIYNARPSQYGKPRNRYVEVTDEENQRLVELYPLSEYDKPRNAYGAMLTDSILGCPTYLGTASAAQHQEDVYYYRFDYDDFTGGGLVGAVHAMEIVFIFDTFDRRPINLLYNQKNTEEAKPLTRIIQGYWVNFAKTGDPNGAGLPEWPRFDLESQKVQALDLNTRTETAKVSDKCAFWDEYIKKHPPVLEEFFIRED
jgi:para-nitrobenzyl esterase